MAQLGKHFQLSDPHLAIMVPSGQQPLFKNRVTWAVTYLKKAGLLQAVKRGVYQITEAGLAILKQDIDYINLAYLEKFDAYKEWTGSFGKAEAHTRNRGKAGGKRNPGGTDRRKSCPRARIHRGRPVGNVEAENARAV
ncbi:hypothetical protein E0486_13910 [Flaviaesturariibacter aridisoli]|uniref:Restriction system protein Mrr-like N-terminal domain-containing protein n=1 Tax=Flaviaesturariibacter aridisoli TaxID=2545761 RepID=A0A4R4DYM8_9BACT|nr:hypothetical protein E0486_13910 [Flaviaesturariibacter aridisoli]